MPAQAVVGPPERVERESVCTVGVSERHGFLGKVGRFEQMLRCPNLSA